MTGDDASFRDRILIFAKVDQPLGFGNLLVQSHADLHVKCLDDAGPFNGLHVLGDEKVFCEFVIPVGPGESESFQIPEVLMRVDDGEHARFLRFG